MITVELSDLRSEALSLIADIPAGKPLDPLAFALIRLGVAVSVTCLDRTAIIGTVEGAFDAGATVAQVQEIMALVSGLGVHTLMASSLTVLDAAARRNLLDPGAPLDPERQVLWDRHVGDNPFWVGFSAEMPGFLEAMLRLSPDIFTAFFAYCAVPWASGTVRARIKELVAMACDASPTHRFRPGFRVHLKNAILLGVGRHAIEQTLDLAAGAPSHSGWS